MRKSKYLLIATLSVAGSAFAGDKIDVKTAAGSSSYEADGVEQIRFDDTGIVIVKSDSNGDTFPIGDVQAIVFSDGQGAVQSITAEGQSARLTAFIPRDGSSLTVFGWDSDETASLKLYNASGSLVKQVDGWNGSQVDISDLPHGVYILNIGGKSAKIRK